MYEMWFNYFAKDPTISLFVGFGLHESYMFAHEHVDFYELVLVLGGTAEHIVGGESFPLGKGDVFVMKAGSSHAYENAKGLYICNVMFPRDMLLKNETEYMNISGYEKMFGSNSFSRAEFKSFTRLSPKALSEAESLVRRLEAEYKGAASGRNALLNAYFTELVVFISRISGTAAKKREIHGITEAAFFLEEHYMEPCPIKQAAEISNYSRRHFSRLFTAAYGVSPSEYLLEVRLKNARDILLGTGLSVAQTASKCGFSDSSYFSKVFKDKYGTLPGKFRKGT